MLPLFLGSRARGGMKACFLAYALAVLKTDFERAGVVITIDDR
jgi:hypothetical protein